MNINSIIFPKGYDWLKSKGLVGFSKFSQLQPWYYLSEDQVFWANDRWANVFNENLLFFAKRQDNDDLACFKVLSERETKGIYLIHGWTSSGFEIIQYFPDFWSWLHFVIKDIEEWVEIAE